MSRTVLREYVRSQLSLDPSMRLRRLADLATHLPLLGWMDLEPYFEAVDASLHDRDLTVEHARLVSSLAGAAKAVKPAKERFK